MLFDCQQCGAKQTVGLPSDDANDVVCASCHAKQSRRGYEVLRIKAELTAARQGGEELAALKRAAAAARIPESASGNAGTHKPSLLLYALVFVGVLALGIVALFAVGKVIAEVGPIVNLAFLAGGAGLTAFGVRAIRSPTTLQIAPVTGHDAWGKTEYGPSRPATAEQGTLAGAICLVVGAAMVVLGIFIGAF